MLLLPSSPARASFSIISFAVGNAPEGFSELETMTFLP
jgi:hypothetical protein